MGRTVKRLSGLEIDEVSLVNRPANQHGIVTIAKAQEAAMPIFDNQGDEVGEEELEHGDVVYDEAGNEFVFVEDDASADEMTYEDELVGKASFGPQEAGVNRFLGGARRSLGRSQAGAWGREAKAKAGKARAAGHRAVGSDRATAYSTNAHRAADSAFAGSKGGKWDRFKANTAGQYGAHPGRFIGGGVAATSTAGGAAYYGGKSLGDQVMESLSKALTDDDRSEVIANAMDYMENVAKSHEDLQDLVAEMLEDRETNGFVELAKGYELPADPNEIAGLMYRASQFMPESDLATMDRMFSSVSEIAKSSYDEIGYYGGYESDALAQVYATAGEVVSKSGAAMTQEQAVTALFDANPAAYDMYEAEQR